RSRDRSSTPDRCRLPSPRRRRESSSGGYRRQPSLANELPAAVWVVLPHFLDDLVGLLAQVPFVHSTVPADEEGHDPRRTVRDGIGDERKAARHAAVPQVALRPTRRGRALRGEDAEVVAPPRPRRSLPLRVDARRGDRRAEGALVALAGRRPVEAVPPARVADDSLRVRLHSAVAGPAGVDLLRAHV